MKRKNVLFKDAFLSAQSYKFMNACLNGAFIDLRSYMPKIIISTDYPKQLKKVLGSKFFLNTLDVNRFSISTTTNFSRRFQSVEIVIIKDKMEKSYNNFMNTKTDGTFYDLLKLKPVRFKEGLLENCEKYRNRDETKIFNLGITKSAKSTPNRLKLIKTLEKEFLNSVYNIKDMEEKNILTDEGCIYANKVIEEKFNEYKDAIIFVSSTIFGGEFANALSREDS